MYKIELIYTKARYKGLSSPELVLEKKKERRLAIWYVLTYLVLIFVTIFVDALGLVG